LWQTLEIPAAGFCRPDILPDTYQQRQVTEGTTLDKQEIYLDES